MALNFPNNPTLNDVYIDTTSGFSYQWNGTVWISFSAASSSQIKVLDDISGSFTGIAFTFALTSSSTSISPPNAQSLIINLGGVIQDPSDDYIVSGSNIIFSTAPNNGLSFSGVSLGPAIPVTTIPSGTTTGGSFTVAGLLSTTNLYVSGISTFVGLATHTGTIFGSNLSLTGVATATGGFNLGIQSTGTNVTTGVITALNFVGTGNTFAYNAGTKTVDISIAGGGGGGGGIGTVINYADSTPSPFSYIDAEVTVTSNLNLDATNAGATTSYVVSVVPNITIASGIAVTVGTGKTMVIDILNLGDL